MHFDQWHERWRTGRIGFHASAVAPALTAYWPTLNLPPGSTVLVPFCGKSLDLLWLRDQQHGVVGVELSEIAVEAFFTENGIAATRIEGEACVEYRAPGLRLLCGDLLQLTPEMLEGCTTVYDRAALIAIPPQLQGEYASKMAALTSCGTQTLLVTLEYPQHEMPGPPYSVNSEVVSRLYSGHHRIELLDRADVWASDPLRNRSLSQLHEACYRLTRL